MELDQARYWVALSDRRRRILEGFSQPLTATQVSRRTGFGLDSCRHHIWSLKIRGLLRCLNPNTRFNRLYCPTRLGLACWSPDRRRASERIPASHLSPELWDLYSSLCYRHRAAAIEAMRGSMQAAAIRRRAVIGDRSLRMSANNVRDVMKYLLRAGIVRRLRLRRRGHPRYELTELGLSFQRLLVGLRMRGRT